MITELPARVVNRWQVEGGDLAILPVGSLEALAPHLPMGARGFEAEAFAKVLAEAADGLLLPLLPMSPVFGTQGHPGTIDTSEAQVNRVIRAVLDDLVETGFRRIVLVTYLEYAAYYLPQELWEDTRGVVVGADLAERLHPGMKAAGLGEDSLVLGALKMLGRDDLVERCLDAHKQWLAEGRGAEVLSEAYEEVGKLGFAGVRFPKGFYPVVPSARLDVEAGAGIIRQAALDGVKAVDAMRRYNEFIVRRGSRGFLKGGWFRRPPAGEGKEAHRE